MLEQFSDFMILVLMAAAVISGVMGDLVDTLVILVIVLLNAAIGLVQSWRADQALAALQRLSPRRPRCCAAVRYSKFPRTCWCRGTSYCSKLATRCQPICA